MFSAGNLGKLTFLSAASIHMHHDHRLCEADLLELDYQVTN